MLYSGAALYLAHPLRSGVMQTIRRESEKTDVGSSAEQAQIDDNLYVICFFKMGQPYLSYFRVFAM